MPVRGKIRLLAVVAALAVIVVGILLVSSRRSNGGQALTPTPTIAIANVPTATPAQVAQLTSYALKLSDFPAATRQLTSEVYPNQAAAENNPQQLMLIEATGRVTGYLQQWRNDTLQQEYLDQIELYRAPEQAITRLMNRATSNPAVHTMDLPSPQLGDASRMYTYSQTAPNGQLLSGFVVAWVRGRVLFLVNGDGNQGDLKGQTILDLAKKIDAKAAASPLK